jgi:predicted lipoprotein with Yx(FWY)xxD motif
MNIRYARHLLTLGLVVTVAACGDNSTAKAGPDASTPDAPAPDAAIPPSVTLSTAGGLGARLVDKDGKSLYFFVNDVPKANASTNTNPAWTPFDVQSPTVGDGLVATDFGRFDRGGGVFQSTWKGRPLYYFANDTADKPVNGEGTGGRWFVARAYNLFFAANAAVTPAGATAANAPFLTNGAGRSLYVTKMDTRGLGATLPISVCGMNATCAAAWPLWEKPATLTNVVVPSTIQAADLTSFTSQGKEQFVYKGWPLYFFGTDVDPGQIVGSTKATWYAVTGAWDGTLP